MSLATRALARQNKPTGCTVCRFAIDLDVVDELAESVQLLRSKELGVPALRAELSETFGVMPPSESSFRRHRDNCV